MLKYYFFLLLSFVFCLSAKANGRPHFHPEQGIIVSIDGDIWWGQINKKQQVKSWIQITNGLEEERDPVWLPDGEHVVFASNRDGQFQLLKYHIKSKEQTFLAPSQEPQTQPSISKDGTIAWVSGLGPNASLWLKKPGQPALEIKGTQGANSPALHPEGHQLLFIRSLGPVQELCLLPFDKKVKVLDKVRQAEYPAWSHQGRRITFSSRTNNPGIWMTDQNASYFNIIKKGNYQSVWGMGDEKLVLIPLKARPPYHNGDQDIHGSRYLEVPYLPNGELMYIKAPAAPNSELGQSIAFPERDLQEIAMKKWLEVTQHLDKKYEQAPEAHLAEWQGLKKAFTPRITKAKTLEEVESLIYELLQEKPYLRAEKEGKAGVSSAHPLASAAGISVMKKGGNVVDAAVAVSFALGVVEPDASGLGGYGEMLIYLKEMDEPTCIEFLTRVPEAASLTNGALDPLPRGGPIMVNIPGTVAGMYLAWKKYGSGKVSWSETIEPALALAENGFVLDASFPTTLFKEQREYLKYPSSKALFFKDGTSLQPGDTLKNPDLAWTLKEIANGGADAFYKGKIADKLVKDLRSHGNVMTKMDMARYYAVERQPVKTTYRGHTVYSGPPPVSGGANLVGQLNQLENFTTPGIFQDEPAALHALVEAWKLTPSGRGKIADPGLWPIDLSEFYDKTAAAKRWSTCFDPSEALTPQRSCQDTRHSSSWGAEKVLDAKSNTGTTAFAVADGEGNMVSVTQTLGTWGGNFYVSPGLGFLYNDKLGSYSRNPQSFNARIPFARNVTSICPTLVFKGERAEKKPLLAVGAAGNAWITSAVYHIVTGVIDNDLSPQAAIEQPRVLVGVRRNPQNPGEISEVRLQAENGFSPEVIQGLEQRGHKIQWISNRGELRMGYSAAVMVKDGKVFAGADPRRSGEAKVIGND